MGRVDTCLAYQLVRTEDRTEEDIRTEDGKIITGCQKERTFPLSKVRVLDWRGESD